MFWMKIYFRDRLHILPKEQDYSKGKQYEKQTHGLAVYL